MAWEYTQVKHRPRIALGLSTDEYCLLDLIHRRSRAVNAPVKGWCVTSQSNLCKDLGLKIATFKRMVKKLKDTDFIISDANGKLKKVAPKFYNAVYCEERYQNDTNNGIKMIPDSSNNGIKMIPEQYQNDTENGIKMIPSNIVGNISKVINTLSEQSSPMDDPVPFVKIVIQYLSAKTGKTFRIPPDEVTFKKSEKFSLINARLRQGNSVKDLINVIDVKCAEWLEDPENKKYLRPSTLFRASNFERYLDEFQNIDTSATGQNVNVISSQQEEAKKVLRQLYKKHRNIWKEKYTNKAKTNYVEALRMFYFDNPTLKPSTNGTTTA